MVDFHLHIILYAQLYSIDRVVKLKSSKNMEIKISIFDTFFCFKNVQICCLFGQPKIPRSISAFSKYCRGFFWSKKITIPTTLTARTFRVTQNTPFHPSGQPFF